MDRELIVILHPESVTMRMLLAAAHQMAKSPLKHYPQTQSRPELLQVQCTRVEATEYGLVRLALGANGQSPAVSVQPALLIAVLDSADQVPVGFLSDLDGEHAL